MFFSIDRTFLDIIGLIVGLIFGGFFLFLYLFPRGIIRKDSIIEDYEDDEDDENEFSDFIGREFTYKGKSYFVDDDGDIIASRSLWGLGYVGHMIDENGKFIINGDICRFSDSDILDT